MCIRFIRWLFCLELYRDFGPILLGIIELSSLSFSYSSLIVQALASLSIEFGKRYGRSSRKDFHDVRLTFLLFSLSI